MISLFKKKKKVNLMGDLQDKIVNLYSAIENRSSDEFLKQFSYFNSSYENQIEERLSFLSDTYVKDNFLKKISNFLNSVKLDSVGIHIFGFKIDTALANDTLKGNKIKQVTEEIRGGKNTDIKPGAELYKDINIEKALKNVAQENGIKFEAHVIEYKEKFDGILIKFSKKLDEDDRWFTYELTHIINPISSKPGVNSSCEYKYIERINLRKEHKEYNIQTMKETTEEIFLIDFLIKQTHKGEIIPYYGINTSFDRIQTPKKTLIRWISLDFQIKDYLVNIIHLRGVVECIPYKDKESIERIFVIVSWLDTFSDISFENVVYKITYDNSLNRFIYQEGPKEDLRKYEIHDITYDTITYISNDNTLLTKRKGGLEKLASLYKI